MDSHKFQLVTVGHQLKLCGYLFPIAVYSKMAQILDKLGSVRGAQMSKIKQTTFLGIMLAVVVVLSWLEFVAAALLLLPPHIKLGLANIAIMYCTIFVNKKTGIMLGILKSLFVLLTRGPVAGLLSLCGGLLSIVIIILLLVVFRHKISYVALSIAGAIAHNVGQLVAIVPMFGGLVAVSYLPVMIVSGIVMGTITGILLKATLSAFNSIPR